MIDFFTITTNNRYMEELAKRVREIREAKGLNQEDFAKGLDLDRSYVSKLESGSINLKKRHIVLICKAYGVNENWLCTGTGGMFVEKDLAETPEEKELLNIFDRLGGDMQDFFLNMGRDLLAKSESKKAKTPKQD